jgi:hypothetical protein
MWTLRALALSVLWAGTAAAQQPARFVDFIDVTERDSRVDITLQFTCSLRYTGHSPAQEGEELRLRLRPGADCGISGGAETVLEFPALAGAENVIRSARLESDMPGEIALSLAWVKRETFILAQGADPRGLKIRLLRERIAPGDVSVAGPGEPISNYAVNLESQREPFDQGAIDLASQRLKMPAFVSVIELEGEKWYRLRVGPIERRSIAEQLLRTAARDYPRAWLAIGDDAVTSDPSATAGAIPLPAVEPIGSDPALDPATRKSLLAQARKAMSARDYTTAIKLLTQLQRQPEYAERSQAQELLGLARERAGQLAHAKAEYEEYLRRYPGGDAAERVRTRLRILRSAEVDARSAARRGGDLEQGWQLTGGASQLYRRDSNETTTAGVSEQFVTQNVLFNDADLFARRRGERLDMAARASAGYAKDLLPDGPGDQTRVSVAYFEMVDRILGLSGRLGRQSRSSDGVLGTFDGLALSYQLRPAWTLDGNVGLPVESSHDAPSTTRRFATLALGYNPPGAPWDVSMFVAGQTFDGMRDRQAVGFEMSYFVPTHTIVALLDYDIAYNALNYAVLIGTLQLPARWTITYDFERRNTPILTTRNALIGQPVDTLSELRTTFTDSEIYDLAEDRTPVLSSYALSATRPLGERFQISMDVIGSQIGATAASGGVAAQPETGLDTSYQLQLFANSLFRSGDFNVLAFRYDDSAAARLASVGLTSRVPVFGAWRLSPRVRVDQRRLNADGSTQWLYIPSLRIDYQRNHTLFELEMAAELGSRDQASQPDESRRYFIGMGYRIGF